MMATDKHLATMFTFVFVIGLVAFAIAAGIPKGTYTVKTSDGAIWDLTLDGSGNFKAIKDGVEKVIGKYKINKDEIVFTDKEGPFAERGDAKTGTYKWKLADHKLVFTNINDKADGRSSTLTAGPWEMKK
jgi:hypothetical protein